ncbi:uncharacterized protein LOC128157655 [Crassostrea angulata]|uniref:uncharacterized protein LOC128157655 n=1 Tax=Magallana angulata TaxID=2784310 RepID=UPI0022B2188A|nr:uncharacterized protein LOC128157655 [Crassostrea angulata]
MKDDNLMESSNGEKHISIKDQTNKSVGIVADGSVDASLQTTPKSKSKTSDEQNEAGKSENPDKGDSLHIYETPVKEYDVDFHLVAGTKWSGGCLHIEDPPSLKHFYLE